MKNRQSERDSSISKIHRKYYSYNGKHILHTSLSRNWGNKRLYSFFLQRKSKGKLFQNTSGRSYLVLGSISFFLLEGLRSGIWRTRDITVGGKSHTSINFASIENQNSVYRHNKIFAAEFKRSSFKLNWRGKRSYL